MPRVDAPLRGLAIPRAEITFENLLPNVTPPGPLNSSFTQAGPGPGSARPRDALSKLRPVISNAQTEDIEIEVVRAGLPIREGCEVRYKLSSEADSEKRGWNPAPYLHGWRAAEYGSIETFDLFDTATIPSNQKVVLVYKRDSDGAALSRIWDPVTHTWSAQVVIELLATGLHASVVVLPDSERILAMVGQDGGIFSSDDEGATWQLYAEQPLAGLVLITEPVLLKRDRMCVTPDGSIVLFHQNAAVDTVLQFASGDLGATWQLVESSTLGISVDCCTFSDGTIGVVTTADFRRLASPFDLASQALAVAITSGAEVACWTDDDDIVYTIVRGFFSGIPLLTRSLNFGVAWDDFKFRPSDSGDTSTFPINYAASATKGGMWLCTNWAAAPGTQGGSIGGMELGGWSNGVVGTLTSDTRVVLNRSGFGGDAVIPAETWLPFDLPQDTSWVLLGGTGALVAPGELELITVAATSAASQSFATETNTTILAEVRVDAGGSLTADDVSILVRSSDGVNNSLLAIRFTTTGFRVTDVVGAVDFGTVVVDMTTNLLIMIQITGRRVTSVFFKLPEATNWAVGASGTLDFTGVVATGAIQWGHVASTATSHWVQFHFMLDGGDFAADAAFGKAVSSNPYPLPDVSTGDCAFMRLDAGPGTRDEVYDVATVFEFGVERMFPTLDPSPDVRHRTLTDLVETIYAFDLGADSLLARTIFAYLAGTSYRTALVESSSDASAGAVWTLRGTWDAAEGFAGLQFDRTGDSVRPAGILRADRFLGHGEAVGGWMLLAAGVARRVKQHLSGFWGGTVEPEIRVDITGGEPASGTMNLNFSAGVLVIQTDGTIRDRYWRIRIPVQDTPEGFFETGLMLLGYVQPAGKQHGWDWSVTARANRDEQTSAYGTSRFRELGPIRRTWSAPWTEGNDMLDLRQNVDPDFQAHSGVGAPPLATRNDVWQLLWGLFEELESGERVCLAMPAIPDVTGMVTDRTLYTYGRVGDRIRADGVVGDEGISELVRVQPFPVAEIR